MISFYILPKRSFVKREGLSDERLASLTKKEYGCTAYFLYRFTKT